MSTDNHTHFLRLPAVKQRTGLSRSGIYAKVALGEFPAPVSLGARASAWIEAEVEDWANNRIKASRSSLSTASVAQ